MSNKLVPQIGPEHGTETRNTINRLIQIINDRGVEVLSELAFLEWLNENGIRHAEEVATFNSLPQGDPLNTVRGVQDESKIYIKKEEGWLAFQSIDINKINEVEDRLLDEIRAKNQIVTSAEEPDDDSVVYWFEVKADG